MECRSHSWTRALGANKWGKAEAKYILAVKWTEQGIRNIENSVKRVNSGRALGKKQAAASSGFGTVNAAWACASDNQAPFGLI